MAVQKKKKKKNVNNTQQWNWTPQRIKAAQLLSTGLYTQKEVAGELSLTEETISRWMHTKDFKEEVNELTIKNELATRAGLLRLAFQAVDKKKNFLVEDKNTVLDWAEFIVKIFPEDTTKDDGKLQALTDAIMNSAKMIGK